MIERENDGIKVNLVSPDFTGTALNNFHAEASLEDDAHDVVHVARFGPNDPSGGLPAEKIKPLLVNAASATSDLGSLRGPLDALWDHAEARRAPSATRV